MKLFKDKIKKKIFISVIIIVFILTIIIASGIIYVNDFYRADLNAIGSFVPINTIQMQIIEDHTIIFQPSDEVSTGFIFYPGGKVEYTAYIPLMKALASRGTLCVLIEMPFNLAVLDINAADGIQNKYPQIENWYIGGHSLGGSMAASYVSKHINEFDGLILLGSYSTDELINNDLKVLSIYGSEDTIINHEKYEKNKANLPENFSEVIINGGCHSYFGMYGMQEGDGIPSITNEEQINQTVDAIIKLFNLNEIEMKNS